MIASQEMADDHLSASYNTHLDVASFTKPIKLPHKCFVKTGVPLTTA